MTSFAYKKKKANHPNEGQSSFFKYRRPSLIAGVTFQEYPADTKTANNEGPLFGPFSH